MDASAKALRAVAAELVRRKIQGVAMIVGAVLVVLLLVSLYLTSLNGWWALLTALVVFFLTLFVVALFGVRLLLRVIGLRLGGTQKKAVRKFVDELETVLGRAQTPLPFFAFRLAGQLLFKRRVTLIGDVINEAAVLKPSFLALLENFKSDG